MKLTVHRKLTGLVWVIVASVALSGLLAHRALDTVKVGGRRYQSITQVRDLAADVRSPQLSLLEPFLLVNQLAAGRDPGQTDAQIERLTRLRAEFDARHAHWVKSLR